MSRSFPMNRSAFVSVFDLALAALGTQNLVPVEMPDDQVGEQASSPAPPLHFRHNHRIESGKIAPPWLPLWAPSP
jgi:hypothetical protein